MSAVDNESGNRPQLTDGEAPATNTVAVAGVVFGMVAMGLYSGLFYWVRQLPDSAVELQTLQSHTPSLLKLILLGGSGTLLNLVALILCVAGLLLPHRSRWLALGGTIVFGAMFLGIACVVLLGTLAP